MKIYRITKGNFALENTRDIRPQWTPHENNLRFHIEIEEKYYEYAIDTINKKTINIRCVIGKSKFRNKCYARLTPKIVRLYERQIQYTEQYSMKFLNTNEGF